MNDDQLKLTKQQFPLLYSFAMEYGGDNRDDLRWWILNKPILILGGSYWIKYEKALEGLLKKDREYLLEKLKKLTIRSKRQKSWNQFEEKLNEALAYMHVLQKESQVHFIEEKQNTGEQPDIAIYTKKQLTGLVEVKTIGYSLNEYDAVEKELSTGDGRFLQMQAHKTLYKKITDDLNKAVKQMWSYSKTKNLVRKIFLFLNLDSGILMDFIFAPKSDLEQFLCGKKKELQSGTFSVNKEKIELKIYLTSGLPAQPKELKCR